MKAESKARTEVGLKKVEGRFERRMNQPDLPEGHKSMLAEMKGLSLTGKKAGKARSTGDLNRTFFVKRKRRLDQRRPPHLTFFMCGGPRSAGPIASSTPSLLGAPLHFGHYMSPDIG